METKEMKKYKDDMHKLKEGKDTIQSIIALHAYVHQCEENNTPVLKEIFDPLMEKAIVGIVKAMDKKKDWLPIDYKDNIGDMKGYFNRVIVNKVRDKYYGTNLESNAFWDLISYTLKSDEVLDKQEYDLALYASKYSSFFEWPLEILCSDIPINIRAEILIKYLSEDSADMRTACRYLNDIGSPHKIEYFPKYKATEKIREILDYICKKNKNVIIDKFNICAVESIMKAGYDLGGKDSITRLFERKFHHNYELWRFVDLYKSGIYQSTASIEEKNKDVAKMIERIHPDYLYDLIHIAALNISVEMYDLMIRKITDNLEERESNDLDWLCSYICDSIIRRSRNRQEYKANCILADEFAKKLNAEYMVKLNEARNNVTQVLTSLNSRAASLPKDIKVRSMSIKH